MATIADRILSHYDSNDFKETYKDILLERYNDNEGDIIRRIMDLFNAANYETQKELTNWQVLDREQATKVYRFIYDNFDEFVKDFSSYWVGPVSLESVSFGEQEEQLTGMSKPGGGVYTLRYMQRVFDAAGYYVKGEYAYKDIGGGLHVDLLSNNEVLNEFLKTI